MATKVHMEALSPTMEEGQLVRWLKAEGDEVSNGDVLAEIETDKATMELVARGDGVLRKVLLEEGGTAPVGEVIAIIAGADESIEGLVGSETEEPDGGESEEGEGPEGEGPGEAGRGPSQAETQGGDEEVGGEEGPDARQMPDDSHEGSGEAEPGEGAERIKASPLARRLAEDMELDLRDISGSGPGGRIVKQDVEAAKSRGGPSAPPPSAAPVEGEEGGPDHEDRPLSQMRKTIAKRLVESISPVPHFFLRVTVDMTRILEARAQVNDMLEGQEDKVSINDFLLKITAHALERHPEVNAEWMGDAIRRHFRVHLGVAVAVEDGLITPVIRDANRKGLVRISREMKELAARGREKKLQPEEYTGSTFSVSNLGMFGIHEFTGVINPPEAGILAVGGIEETPVVEEEELLVKPLMRVTMSCDHRVIDGATGARFLRTLKGMLEEPGAVLV